MNLKDIKNKAEENYENYELNSKANIYLEFRSEIDTLSNRIVELLIDVGYDIYMKADYATPTGIGMAIWEYITDDDNYEKLLKFDFEKEGFYEILYREIFNEYSYSDWR